MDVHIYKCRGFLLLELLLALVIVLVVWQFLIPLLSQSRNEMLTKKQTLTRMDLKSAVIDHFQSQLQPILWRACGVVSSASISFEIGSSAGDLPDRLASKNMAPDTDWLQATERAACHYSTRVTDLDTIIPYSCDWNVGDEVVFEACDILVEGVLTKVTSSKSYMSFSDDSIINQAGMLVSHNPYYWFLNTKEDYTAFWRTPEVSGNSLELWAGIDKLAIYPLLDQDLDGRFDTLSMAYQSYPLRQLKGFWLELIVNELTCQTASESNSLTESYQTQRNLSWSYDAKCAFPIQFVVTL